MNRGISLLKRVMLPFVLIYFWGHSAMPQARMVLDGAIMNISGGASLVIENPANNALVRNSGHIISEGENNTLRWHIGTATGTYMVPWGYGSNNYIPLSFTKDSGTGAGHFVFSTYQTGWLNSAKLPSTVTDLNSNGSDNSSFVLDRFWQISARSYAAKPTLTDFTFTYLDGEHLAEGNTITEEGLQAQRWNDNLSQWGDFAPAGIGNPSFNTVIISSVNASDLFGWWVLVDKAQPLPVALLYFKARAEEMFVRLFWETATEVNNKAFIVERSRDGKRFEYVATVAGIGNSSERRHYNVFDKSPLPGISYYRLKQVDFNGVVHFSGIIWVNTFKSGSEKLVVYPNPVINGRFSIELPPIQDKSVQLELYDLTGKKVFSKIFVVVQELMNVQVGPDIKPGVYFLKLCSTLAIYEGKVLIQ